MFSSCNTPFEKVSAQNEEYVFKKSVFEVFWKKKRKKVFGRPLIYRTALKLMNFS